MIGLIIMVLLTLKIHRLTKQAGQSSFFWVLAAIISYLGIQFLIVVFTLLILSSFLEVKRFMVLVMFLSEFFSLLGVWTIVNYLDGKKQGGS
ncbi:MAG: hypothetical protein N2Z23_08475 [Pyrinomonadaceae bacterium]|nr:hypothetical protein [Pyrinomonadaceae bacterium]MCX7640456.1 hypothetical protein [Pyrinomonadaceae bacterium]MDW8304883.1 hypothetical protein [Acidobacteriota bacterium]